MDDQILQYFFQSILRNSFSGSASQIRFFSIFCSFQKTSLLSILERRERRNDSDEILANRTAREFEGRARMPEYSYSSIVPSSSCFFRRKLLLRFFGDENSSRGSASTGTFTATHSSSSRRTTASRHSDCPLPRQISAHTACPVLYTAVTSVLNQPI